MREGLISLATIGPSWFYHPLGYCAQGASYLGCRSYNFWSGIAGSFIVSLPGWFAVSMLFWYHHTCAAPRCPRIGKHPTADNLHRLCRIHHPDLPDERLSLEQIQDRHRQAKALLQKHK